jgi:hypothetical protein
MNVRRRVEQNQRSPSALTATDDWCAARHAADRLARSGMWGTSNSMGNPPAAGTEENDLHSGAAVGLKD